MQLDLMNIENILAYLIIAPVALANIIVTLAIVRSELFERRQKVYQYCLIWLLPFVGAAVVYAFSREPETKGSGIYRAESISGDDPNIGIGNAANDYFEQGHH
jgi:beta-lactamase regulating signal transducer with metallopeptidase domain